MAPNSLVDPSLIDHDFAFPSSPPPAAPAEEPKHLPKDLEVKNKSQLQRLARHLFGPLTRVTVNDDGVTIKVGDTLVGSDSKGDLKQVLENAAIMMAKVLPKPAAAMRDTGIDTVQHRRFELLYKLPHSYRKEERQGITQGIFGARDHELFEIEKLTRATTEGKLEAREFAARELKKMLDASAARFLAEQKKLQSRRS